MTGSSTPASSVSTLGQLAKLLRTHGERGLRERVDGAALVLGTHTAGQPLFDTPTAGRPTPSATLTMKTPPAPTPGGRDTERGRPAARPPREFDATDPSHLVLPLVKSDRNPFAGMLTVGRAKNNDLIIASPQVSKVHAWLQQRGGRWHLRDKGTTNGTFIDCVRLDPGVDCPLVSGHTIRFAEVICRFVEPGDLLELCRAVPD